MLRMENNEINHEEPDSQTECSSAVLSGVHFSILTMAPDPILLLAIHVEIINS